MGCSFDHQPCLFAARCCYNHCSSRYWWLPSGQLRTPLAESHSYRACSLDNTIQSILLSWHDSITRIKKNDRRVFYPSLHGKKDLYLSFLTYFLNTEKSEICHSSFIHYYLYIIIFISPQAFFCYVWNSCLVKGLCPHYILPSSLSFLSFCEHSPSIFPWIHRTQPCPQALMSLSLHLSADSGKGGSCAADLLGQWPQGWGLWHFLDIQSSGCHKDRPVRLGCQQRLWRYARTSTSNLKRILSAGSLPSTCGHSFLCLNRASVAVAEKAIWDTRVRRHQRGASEGCS